MNSDVKQKWVAALRSGEYQQGTGALHTTDKFCCLGVLCELAVAEGVTTTGPHTGTFDVGYSVNLEAMSLPVDVREWAGLETDDPVVTIEVDTEGWVDEDTMIVHPTLSEINDDYGRSFPEIADLIEEQL